jgi:hypothetical protein
MAHKIRKELKRLNHIYDELFKKNSKNRIFYLHIPKCGGNSIDSAFKKHFRPGSVFKEDSFASNKGAENYFKDIVNSQQLSIENNLYLQKYREAILLYNMYIEKYYYISGHFSFSDIVYDLFKNQYRFVTILRNPVQRFISEFFFNKYKQKITFNIDEGLDMFSNSPRGIEYGLKYVKMLGGYGKKADIDLKDAIQNAKENLAKFDIIGILEDLNNFEKQIKDKLDISLKIGHKNKNPIKVPAKKKVSDKNLEKIKRLCRPDEEIYEFALNIYNK